MTTAHARTRTRWTLPASLMTLAVLGACSSTPIAPTAAPATTAAAPAAAPAPGNMATPPAARPAALAPSAAMPAVALPAHRDPASVIARERVVYFDFDSDLLDAEDRGIIDRHARYLMTAPALTLKIEGHTDDRGGSEYNLALGQRRAEAVRKALALLGVDTARTEATSWGEERPQDRQQAESAWARNRRAELAYPPR